MAVEQTGSKMISCNHTDPEGCPSKVMRWDRRGYNCPMEAVGDDCVFKANTSIIFMPQNINRLGLIAENTKELAVKEFMLEKKVDVMRMQETHVCWYKAQNVNKIWDRFRGWRESGGCHLNVAYNSRDKLGDISQYGGTSIVTLNNLTNIYSDSGVDDTKLGRCAYTRFRGSEGRVFQVISVY